MVVRRRPLQPLELDLRSGLPVYRQIVRQVQHRAAAGRLRPGDQLPTVRALAQRLGVNFNTVARAYRLLGKAGVLSAQPGRGTFLLRAAQGRGPGRTALQTLAADYITQARRLGFTNAQIARALIRSLKLLSHGNFVGDNHE